MAKYPENNDEIPNDELLARNRLRGHLIRRSDFGLPSSLGISSFVISFVIRHLNFRYELPHDLRDGTGHGSG